MTFDDILEQVITLLKRQGRVSYRALKMRFDIDDEYLDVLKEEILFAYPVVDEEGRGFAWTGEAEAEPEPTVPPTPQSEVIQATQSAQTEPLPPEPPTPDAERRQLTVMFCDLTDSTRLSGQLDPEDLRDVIRAYQSTSAEVIERYDGYIAQHLGDGLMVYFGWPQAHEDDAQRAVHAGLGILAEIAGLNVQLEQEKGIRLAVRIGIHTGLVVVGEIGKGASQEHLALGETPNIASRIESIAEPDTVAISDTTYQLMQGYFVCDDLGQHTLKGVNEPQHVYQAVKESDAQSRLDVAATRGLTPLVGRESETAMLFERWKQVKAGQGQVILLSGEAGIGKSRLLQVLRDHVADELHTRLECRSSPYYQNTALYPITGMLQRMLQFQADDTPEQRLEKLQQELSQYRLPLEESVPLLAPLLSLSVPEDRYPPLQWSPQRQRQKALESIVAILLEQAERQPVLFVLEDLHWLDPTSLELLDLLLEQTPTAPILTLLTCRPTFQPTWSSRSYLTQMTLNRLSHGQIELMTERVTGGKRIPGEVLKQIVEKTDGVPLFVEEMTKVVLESGTLKELRGQLELAGPLSTLTIPATLQDSLMARLDRLVTAKAVAQYAAVIGRQFSYNLLHDVSQLNERTLQDELHRLVEAELVYQRGLPPQATYVFKHALIQDTAYQSLLKSTRQQYHQRIAQVLERQFSEVVETQPELVAHHYTEAGLNERAVHYWHMAGQLASKRLAHVEAVAHLTKGLEVLQTLPETMERARDELGLQITLGPSLLAIRGPSAVEVGRAYTRARELCEKVGDTAQLSKVLEGLFSFHGVRGELQTAQELAEQQLRLAQHRHDEFLRFMAHVRMGFALYFRGELTQGRLNFEQAMALYDPPQHSGQARLVGAADLVVVCLSHLAYSLIVLGYPNQAVTRIHEALSRAQELAHPYSLAYALVHAIHIDELRQEVHAVHKQADTMIAICEEQGFAFWLPIGRFFQGWAMVSQGHGEAGVDQMCQGIPPSERLMAPYFRGRLAEAYVTVGQIETGWELITTALNEVNQGAGRFYIAELYRLQGELLLQFSANLTEVESCFHQAISNARAQQAKSLELRAATSLARLWQSQGKRQEAYELLEPVYGWFTEGFDTADLREAKALLVALA